MRRGTESERLPGNWRSHHGLSKLERHFCSETRERNESIWPPLFLSFLLSHSSSVSRVAREGGIQVISERLVILVSREERLFSSCDQ